jgi:phosphohistidine phosphatase SixA
MGPQVNRKVTRCFWVHLAALAFFTACGRTSTIRPTFIATPSATILVVTPSIAATTLARPASSTATAAPSATVILKTPAATLTLIALLTPSPSPLSGAALVSALRGGGYVTYFRHAATTPTPDDARPVVLADCATQRNLSETGQAQARAIGQAFARLSIPVGQVRSSPFCRALDTVRLAFGEAEIEPLLENLETAADENERERRTVGLRRLLSAPPDPGTNTILVGHGFNISAAAQVTIPEGGAAVFHPDGAGGYELVAMVPPDGWAALPGQ